MPVLLQIVGVATGEASRADGLYVASYDVNGNMGRGDLELTGEKAKAKRYGSMPEAMEDWRAQADPPFHLRSDGQANRPMTAFTITTVTVDE